MTTNVWVDLSNPLLQSTRSGLVRNGPKTWWRGSFLKVNVIIVVEMPGTPSKLIHVHNYQLGPPIQWNFTGVNAHRALMPERKILAWSLGVHQVSHSSPPSNCWKQIYTFVWRNCIFRHLPALEFCCGQRASSLKFNFHFISCEVWWVDQMSNPTSKWFNSLQMFDPA